MPKTSRRPQPLQSYQWLVKVFPFSLSPIFLGLGSCGGAWQYSAWEMAQYARPDRRLLLLARCCGIQGQRGSKLPAKSREGDFNEKSEREQEFKEKEKNQATAERVDNSGAN